MRILFELEGVLIFQPTKEDPSIRLTPGAREKLQDLIQEQFTVAVVSRQPMHTISEWLKAVGLDAYFTDRRRCCVAGPMNRNRQLTYSEPSYRHFLERMLAQPEDCVLITSSPAAAKAACRVMRKQIGYVGGLPESERAIARSKLLDEPYLRQVFDNWADLQISQ